ncbi:dihydroxyacetone kinase subunit DhaK [Ponticoccus sp. SC2-23]|uniref:dihydroxyacetone kinase subunit DhaK n=1 Tax=Alexandriicola marinus TaxID=2081710 RepID=UPI000FD9041B|nr:dihydroxyacetone kinase subunit DhaK [Alexandriicola marinus]MBM1221268.1 dihydroxyacetone kinase subunit DhaK [Ponticoccus sp. SC6-9]MBM1225838.1 dihydroxyacetone kinase subunit DhaK [Ponticoccus sp. SC6-15]MBM1227990.1 dihydroxyacetone kinase subunit DhaK [Ponticoccus sp. SC6-38]MBM1234372.1 dihydroxyacetone kinase subunit DhaK [Ponticoccus sp. SC6-45]MBM1238492.1 dihydroxyacetone kinase subunit DhaK [Ponticoccus sp. SC6-49]MBM1243761.1 dihydroxyacetone kinase subunit DhaK [Ponticoccus s
MKKLFNSAETMVDDMIDGFVSAFPQVTRGTSDPRVVKRATHVKDPDEKVTLLIGNGSGHEPIAMGFVGQGVLDANVVGDVFAAPSADLILDGLTEVTGKAGSILLISQHSGDMINGRAATMMATDLGIRTVPLPMYDDISAAPPERKQDRRGAPGTMFIYKILGAAAEEGRSLEALVTLGEAVRARLVTLAAAVSPPVSPLTGQRMFTLPDDEIFLGMGVHGEPGVGRVKVGPVRDLVAQMVERLLADRPMSAGSRACVIINGMGGTTLMEQLTIWEEVRRALDRQGITAIAPMIGSYVTTQEMGGFSISLLEPTDDMLSLWCAPSDTPFFPAIQMEVS